MSKQIAAELRKLAGQSPTWNRGYGHGQDARGSDFHARRELTLKEAYQWHVRNLPSGVADPDEYRDGWNHGYESGASRFW